MNKAGRNAFIISVLVFVISTIIVALTENLSVFAYAFIIAVVLQIFVSSVSLRIYEK